MMSQCFEKKWKRQKNDSNEYFLEYLTLIKDEVSTMIHRPSMEGLGMEPWLVALSDILKNT